MSRGQLLALGLAFVAVVPYILLKLLWLGGSTLGLASGPGAEQMHDPRFVVGNVVTVLLQLLALGLGVALTRPWGRRVPGAVLLILSAGATGLLAPILLGLPLGIVLQLAVRGDARTGGEGGLQPWVFGLVYGGFGLLGIAIAVLLGQHAVARWAVLFEAPPAAPRRAVAAGATGLVPFAVAMLGWGLLGPGAYGPLGLDSVAQRTVLVVTGLLAGAGFVVPLVPQLWLRRPLLAWLVTWTGCAVAALQGPALLLLAQDGRPQPAVALVAAVATTGSSLYGLSILLSRRRRLTSQVNG